MSDTPGHFETSRSTIPGIFRKHCSVARGGSPRRCTFVGAARQMILRIESGRARFGYGSARGSCTPQDLSLDVAPAIPGSAPDPGPQRSAPSPNSVTGSAPPVVVYSQTCLRLWKKGVAACANRPHGQCDPHRAVLAAGHSVKRMNPRRPAPTAFAAIFPPLCRSSRVGDVRFTCLSNARHGSLRDQTAQPEFPAIWLSVD
jgi:hypothetical protein